MDSENWVYALHDGEGWTQKDLPTLSQLDEAVVTAWDVEDTEPDVTSPVGSSGWVRWFLLEVSRRAAPHRDLPRPPRCQRSRFRHALCGSRWDFDDARYSPQWQQLVIELRRSGIVDLPGHLAANGPDAAFPMVLEPRLESFRREEPQACVFMAHGSGGYLYVDPFTDTARFETDDTRAAAAAWELYREWAASVEDPVLAVVAGAALSEARGRFRVNRLAGAARYLVAAQLPPGATRQAALSLIHAGTDLSPAGLAIAAAAEAGVPDAARRWGGHEQSWPDVVPVADWVVWDV